MRLSQLVLGPVLLLGLAVPHAVQAGPHGTLSHHRYTEPGGLTREYLQYVPAGLPAGRPLVVFLHGCNETATEAMAATRFNALAEGGTVRMPFGKTFFSNGFGMCVDKFGIPWMVNCPKEDM